MSEPSPSPRSSFLAKMMAEISIRKDSSSPEFHSVKAAASSSFERPPVLEIFDFGSRGAGKREREKGGEEKERRRKRPKAKKKNEEKVKKKLTDGLQNVVGLRDQLHVPVLDPVVDHLDEVAGSSGADVHGAGTLRFFFFFFC